MLNEKSMRKLEGVNPLLVSVIGAAAVSCPIEFHITEGVRSYSRQKMLFEAGKSQTMNSKHLTGDAVDIAVFINGVVNWDFSNYAKVAKFVKEAAQQLGAVIKWGGDFETFKDGPHFQLEKRK